MAERDERGRTEVMPLMTVVSEEATAAAGAVTGAATVATASVALERTSVMTVSAGAAAFVRVLTISVAVANKSLEEVDVADDDVDDSAAQTGLRRAPRPGIVLVHRLSASAAAADPAAGVTRALPEHVTVPRTWPTTPRSLPLAIETPERHAAASAQSVLYGAGKAEVAAPVDEPSDVQIVPSVELTVGSTWPPVPGC